MNIIDIATQHGVKTQTRAGQILLADMVYEMTTGESIQTWVNATTWTTGKLLKWLGN